MQKNASALELLSYFKLKAAGFATFLKKSRKYSWATNYRMSFG